MKKLAVVGLMLIMGVVVGEQCSALDFDCTFTSTPDKIAMACGDLKEQFEAVSSMLANLNALLSGQSSVPEESYLDLLESISSGNSEIEVTDGQRDKINAFLNQVKEGWAVIGPLNEKIEGNTIEINILLLPGDRWTFPWIEEGAFQMRINIATKKVESVEYTPVRMAERNVIYLHILDTDK